MGVLSKGTDFTNGDQITDTSLDNLVDNATFTTSAVDEVSTDIGGSGSIIVKDEGITTGKLANSTGAGDGVTTAKLATAAVTAAKIGTDAVTTVKILDANVTTAKIADANVTFAKLTDVIDDDTMATATATTLATSESIKAYVDNSINRTRVSSATQVLSTAIIPLDNSVPLVSEGTEILTTSFTPQSTSNKLLVEFDGLMYINAPAQSITLALFEGSTCVGARWWLQASDGSTPPHVSFEFTPASATATTYSLRVGGSNAANLTVNYSSTSTATLGGLQEYSMTISEVQA